MPVQQIGAVVKDPQKLTRHIIKIILIAFIFVFLTMYFFDQSFSAYFAKPEIKSMYWSAARTLTDIGLSEYYFLLSIATWAFFAWLAPKMKAFKNVPHKVDFFRRWGLNFLASLFVSGIITHLIKFSVGRQRPHKTPNFDPFVFSPFTLHWHWHSFSSGHSQVMFTVATMMTVAFPKFIWFWFPFAVLICLTRVVVHDHFLSDIIFGACVGYVGSLMAMSLMRAKTENGLFK
ncbi:MAG: phosphatase PAP2 family protein [Bdellovibrio sp.]